MEGYVDVIGKPLSLKPTSAGLTHQMNAKKIAILVDGTDGVATIKCPDKTQFKDCQFFVAHVKGTNYTIIKDGNTTIKTFSAAGHCHIVYDSITDAWIAI